MLKQLLTVVLLAICLINVQAQQLTPPPELSVWVYRKEPTVTGWHLRKK